MNAVIAISDSSDIQFDDSLIIGDDVGVDARRSSKVALHRSTFIGVAKPVKVLDVDGFFAYGNRALKRNIFQRTAIAIIVADLVWGRYEETR